LRFRVISSARHGTPCSSWRTPKPTSSAILGSCRHDRRRLFGKARILEFPTDFPSRARAKVEAEEIRATRAFDQARETLPWSPYGPTEDLAAQVRQYILRTYAAFVFEACRLEALWPADRVRSDALEFLKMLTVKAWREKTYDTGGRVYAGQIRRLPEMTSHVNGAILPEVM